MAESKFHVDENGVRPCNAETPDKCPIKGENVIHVSSLEEGDRVYEDMMDKKIGTINRMKRHNLAHLKKDTTHVRNAKAAVRAASPTFAARTQRQFTGTVAATAKSAGLSHQVAQLLNESQPSGEASIGMLPKRDGEDSVLGVSYRPTNQSEREALNTLRLHVNNGGKAQFFLKENNGVMEASILLNPNAENYVPKKTTIESAQNSRDRMRADRGVGTSLNDSSVLTITSENPAMSHLLRSLNDSAQFGTMRVGGTAMGEALLYDDRDVSANGVKEAIYQHETKKYATEKAADVSAKLKKGGKLYGVTPKENLDSDDINNVGYYLNYLPLAQKGSKGQRYPVTGVYTLVELEEIARTGHGIPDNERTFPHTS